MKIAELTQEYIKFDNGTEVTSIHDQSCCESVFADFQSLQDTPAMSYEFPEKLTVEIVKDAGIRLSGWFIPCYSIQNGYYSSALDLVIKTGDTAVEMDISTGVEMAT